MRAPGFGVGQDAAEVHAARLGDRVADLVLLQAALRVAEVGRVGIARVELAQALVAPADRVFDVRIVDEGEVLVDRQVTAISDLVHRGQLLDRGAGLQADDPQGLALLHGVFRGRSGRGHAEREERRAGDMAEFHDVLAFSCPGFGHVQSLYYNTIYTYIVNTF